MLLKCCVQKQIDLIFLRRHRSQYGTIPIDSIKQWEGRLKNTIELADTKLGELFDTLFCIIFQTLKTKYLIYTRKKKRNVPVDEFKNNISYSI